MTANIFKTAWRNILRHRGYSIINIAGLAIGFLTVVFILLYIFDELQFDRFHEKKDRIARVILDGVIGNQVLLMASSPAPMAKAFPEILPEIENAVRFQPVGRFLIKYGDRSFNENGFVFADSTVFKIFDFPLIKGNPDNALNLPHTLVITEQAAEKYFGSEDPMGKYLTMENGTDYLITGVTPDPPSQSHIQFDFLASMVSMGDQINNELWISNNYVCYLLLAENASIPAVNQKIQGVVKDFVDPQILQATGMSYDALVEAGNRYGYYLEPFMDVYLHSEISNQMGPEGNSKTILIFAVVAGFVLIIGCVNFINLATARSAGRAREVGIRKTLGSHRRTLVFQFLGESFLQTIAAVMLVLSVTPLLLPFFNNITGKTFTMNALFQPVVILVCAVIILAVSLISGAYPALFLASFKPVEVLKGKLSAGSRNTGLRRILVVIQFSISIGLLTVTMIIRDQVKLFHEMDLGFDREQLLILPRSSVLRPQGEIFRSELLRHPQIKSAVFSTSIPGSNNYPYNAHSNSTNPGDLSIVPAVLWTDENYIDTYGIQLREGRNFAPDEFDDTLSCIINQEALKMLRLEEGVGSQICEIGPSAESTNILNVIGVVEDYNFRSLYQTIDPLVIRLNHYTGSYLSIRLTGEKTQETIAFIEDLWEKFVPDKIFEYYFFNEHFNQKYSAEIRTGRLFSIFAFMSIFTGCLGLLGLSSFSAEQRRKEMGIRKVMGATLIQIAVTMMRDMLIMICIAVAVAWTAAYYWSNHWLQNFAYQTELSSLGFILAALTAFFWAAVTMSWQAFRVALANPIEALRYE